MPWRQDWFSELTVVHQEMERFLEDFSRRKPPPDFGFRPWEPAADVAEMESEIVVTVELAGVRQEDLELLVEPRHLYLRGERMEPNPGPKRSCHRLEIYWGPFERLIPLPSPVDPSAVQATFRGGVLTVLLPKAEGRRVNIKNG